MKSSEVVVVGGGPSGMTVALLLARVGHRVVLIERAPGLGGQWASQLDGDGYFLGENSCKVFQSTYQTAPALMRSIGTSWERHFTARHDLGRHWLIPFFSDCSFADLRKLGQAFFLHLSGLRDYKNVSVGEWMEANRLGQACRSWMSATALATISGTLRMTMWELFHRFESNLGSAFLGANGALHWNAQPPNSPDGFVSAWSDELARLRVDVRAGAGATALSVGVAGAPSRIVVRLDDGTSLEADAAFLAIPPPALSRLLLESDPRVTEGFGHEPGRLAMLLRESVYEHLGLAWHFDRPLPTDLPLGGHNVRRGWHPILVQHDQYRRYLRPPAVTVVTGSLGLDSDFIHPTLGTRARDHAAEELGRILWADERRIDPSLPEPIGQHVFGLSSATQIVKHGPLPIKAGTSEVYLATNLNGAAPYFTASLESAVQAGAAAAAAFDAQVERLPTAAGAGDVRVGWAQKRPSVLPSSAAAHSISGGARSIP